MPDFEIKTQPALAKSLLLVESLEGFPGDENCLSADVET